MVANLLDYDLEGLTAFCERLGEKRFRATQLYRWIHQRGAADFDAMSDLWGHHADASCTHPGWSTLKGWASISASWATLLANPQHLQFILTNVRAVINGDTGWVTCDENILDGPGGSTVAACKVFIRDPVAPHGWRLLLHHGSVVHASLS